MAKKKILKQPHFLMGVTGKGDHVLIKSGNSSEINKLRRRGHPLHKGYLRIYTLFSGTAGPGVKYNPGDHDKNAKVYAFTVESQEQLALANIARLNVRHTTDKITALEERILNIPADGDKTLLKTLKNQMEGLEAELKDHEKDLTSAVETQDGIKKKMLALKASQHKKASDENLKKIKASEKRAEEKNAPPAPEEEPAAEPTLALEEGGEGE